MKQAIIVFLYRLIKITLGVAQKHLFIIFKNNPEGRRGAVMPTEAIAHTRNLVSHFLLGALLFVMTDKKGTAKTVETKYELTATAHTVEVAGQKVNQDGFIYLPNHLVYVQWTGPGAHNLHADQIAALTNAISQHMEGSEQNDNGYYLLRLLCAMMPSPKDLEALYCMKEQLLKTLAIKGPE